MNLKLFIKIVSGDKFQKGIERIRAKSKIDGGGFSNEKRLFNWYSKHKSSVKTMEKLSTKFISELGVPSIFWWWHKVIGYVLSNGKIKIYPDRLRGHDPFIEIGYEERSRTGRTDLQLYSGVTKEELKKFCKTNWDLIDPVLRQGFAKKIRSRENPKVVKRIMELWSKTKKELGEKYNEAKEVLISRILKQEGFGHYESENVKQIYYRMRKSKR